MADYYDIVYEESDSFIMELTGANSPIADILFQPTGVVVEVTGTNGAVADILFAPIMMTYEVPSVLITDFAFL